MFSRLNLRLRSLIAMLLTVCLVSASLWSCSAEVMADALSDEIALVAIGGNTGDHAPADKVCNHGCHALTHLTGIHPCEPLLNLPEGTTLPSAEAALEVPSQPRDGPYRPPRSPFQA